MPEITADRMNISRNKGNYSFDVSIIYDTLSKRKQLNK